MYVPAPGITRPVEVAANLAELGNDVIAISRPARQWLEIGLDIKPIRFGTLPVVGRVLLNGYGLVLAVLTIARWKPDVIYTLGGSLGTGFLLAKLFRLPLVTEVNGLVRAELESFSKRSFSMLIGRISCWIDEREIKYSDHIIVVIASMKEVFQKDLDIPGRRITVIPNGANVKFFGPMGDTKKALGLDPDCHYVGFVGGSSPWQGLHNFISCAPLVLEEVPNAKFLLVGDGVVKGRLAESVEELHLTGAFVFVGKVPYTEVPKYINAMDIGISFRKGTPASPLKIYEYMACGKPVVATDSPDNDVVRDHNAGILVNPDDSTETADAIISLLRNDGLREQMGENGRKYVSEQRSWQVVTREIEETIRSVLESKYQQAEP